MKYFTINVLIVFLNKTIHANMIHGLVRSPVVFYDTTRTGVLNNNFSNDLGFLDYTFASIFIDSFEGPIINLILLGNVVSMSFYYSIPALLSIIFILMLYNYCKEVIIALKKLDLSLKNPVYNMIGEMISGVTIIRALKKRFYLLYQFADRLNDSLRAFISYSNTSRAFIVYTNYSSVLVMWVAWIVGIYIAKAETAGLYNVMTIFLIEYNDKMHWCMRQIVYL